MNFKSSHNVMHKKQFVNKKEYAHKNFKPLLLEL